mmetsp:Transcript_41180/g.99206  ORF Transcript_41180/g.99206 Transcript_41180/m.99206 type:complete len:120 (-) Transcript_41180:1618-1977(-)
MAFVPKLPQRSQKAIRRIGMGKMNKIFMFWSKEDVFCGHVMCRFWVILRNGTPIRCFGIHKSTQWQSSHAVGFCRGSMADDAVEAFAHSDPSEYENKYEIWPWSHSEPCLAVTFQCRKR